LFPPVANLATFGAAIGFEADATAAADIWLKFFVSATGACAFTLSHSWRINCLLLLSPDLLGAGAVGTVTLARAVIVVVVLVVVIVGAW
jgi:hypothetical protein